MVTLSGTVGNEFDRTAAGGDAAQIAGVKTVVNNLQVAPSTDAMNSITPGRQHGGSLHRAYRPPPAVRTPSQHQASETVTVPQGTLLSIRLVDAIDSERAKDGDTFHGTLEAPVTIGDTIVIPKYADVEGQVVQAKSAAHFAHLVPFPLGRYDTQLWDLAGILQARAMLAAVAQISNLVSV